MGLKHFDLKKRTIYNDDLKTMQKIAGILNRDLGLEPKIRMKIEPENGETDLNYMKYLQSCIKEALDIII